MITRYPTQPTVPAYSNRGSFNIYFPFFFVASMLTRSGLFLGKAKGGKERRLAAQIDGTGSIRPGEFFAVQRNDERSGGIDSD